MIGMRPNLVKDIEDIAKEHVHFDYPLGQMSTFKAGGNVWAFCEIDRIDMLRNLIGFLAAEDIPYMVLGRASNILVKDEGLEAVALYLTGEFEGILKESNSGNELWVGAGVSLFDLLLYCRDMGFGGLEFLAGIPGKVGGAVCRNAGAFGGEIAEHVVAVELMGEDGAIKTIERSQLEFGYRFFKRPSGSVVTKVLLSLDEDSSESIREKIVHYLVEKKQRQPLDLPSAGSVFKNPTGDHAGRLIEAAGLKGKRIGGAMISPKHANFIVNTGQARASDILALIDLARERVKQEFGTTLELEIEVLG